MVDSIKRLAVLVMVTFIGLSLGLVYWQIIMADELVRRPDNPRLIDEKMRVRRGIIFDRDGGVLARTEVNADGYAKRVYTNPSMVHVTGVDSIRFGATGIEGALDDYLDGRKGIEPQAELDKLIHRQPVVGNDVVLTVDPDIQKAAEKAIGEYRGAAVVLNPRTGEILALYSNPYFDPNSLILDPGADWSKENDRIEAAWKLLNQDDGKPLLNRAAMGLYAPGSTFKTVTLSAALETGVTKPSEVFTYKLNSPNAQHGAPWHANSYVSSDSHPTHESFDLFHAFAYSCNVTLSELGLRVGPKAYEDFARRFGLESRIPLEVPTEVSHLFTRPDFFTGDERFYALASTSMGQGELSVTPLQMALVAAAIANGGVIEKPHLLAEVRRPDGAVLQHINPEAWRTAINRSTADLMRDAMVVGVNDGWANGASLPGVQVAGKTGTAEITGEGQPHSWFIGFAPAN
ncbi:MAG: penicillin-binding transpeptidase domain-containing protein, partial [Dehalococcoidia bacterium]|nr:penicillin-binding transpeptidase domain-containing protein [Dehalococcoidia bacterium]